MQHFCYQPPLAGLDNQAHGLGLALRLLRPLALLCALCLYHSLYCLGTLHSQLKHEARDPAVLQRKRRAWARLEGVHG